MTTHNPDIASRIGPDAYMLRGKVVTEEELVADAERGWKRDYLLAQLDRDTGEALDGLDVHTGALAILKEQGKAENYTDDEYISACKAAGAR
jgi:hypothetical protein